MNVLDVLILILVVLLGLNGFFQGFIHQLFFFAAIFAGVAGAMHLSPYVGQLFSVFTQNQDVIRLLGFALTFVLITVLVGLFGRLIHRGFRLLALGWLDHVLGAVFGVTAALLLTAFGVYVLKALLPSDSQFVRGSTFAPTAEEVVKRMLALVPEHLQKRFEEKLQELRRRRQEKRAPGAAGAPRPGLTVIAPTTPAPQPKTTLETGLVDIRKVSKTIRLDLRYATTDNFLKQKLYNLGRCLLRPAVAKRLARVERSLRRRGLGVKVWDCYRPLAVQWKMWNVAPKPGYVADPRQGSNHNRGAAVDLTLVDKNGNALWMPTDFDDFSERAHHGAKAPAAAARNRRLLRDAMRKEGFRPLPTEWWHYDAPRAESFPLLDVPIEMVP
jgi:D-alanyl-D-alanine dipeptidase